MKAYLLAIGDELLIGQVVNTNAVWLAKELNLIGARIVGHHSTGDTHHGIIEAIRYGLTQADVVVITGGLGSTKDDITKKAIADMLGADMVFHQETYDRMSSFFRRMGREVSEMNRLGCFIPSNATLLTNEVGLAPGMWFETTDNKIIVSMPGVPFEMQRISKDHMLPRLRERLPSSPVAHRTLLTANVGETLIADWIADFEDNLPENVKIAYLPALGTVRLRITVNGTNQTETDRLADELAQTLKGLVAKVLVAESDISMAEALGNMLKSRNLRLGIAESCTGGYLSHLVTAVPGASQHFLGSIVSYDNSVKISRLGVSPETLAQHGAVSEEVVREMALGAIPALGCDVSIAISGIAGPNGGTPEKPVGTIWMAAADRHGRVKTFLLKTFRDRSRNIETSANVALDLLRKFLQETD